MRDFRHALRSALKRPLFTMVAAGSLAIGVGATTALFSVVDVLVVQPVPGVPVADRVVELGRGRRGSGFDTFAYPEIVDMRAEVGALDRVAAFSLADFSVTTFEGGQRAQGFYVSRNYFETLGLVPAEGRFFGADEALERGPVSRVVIGHDFARSWIGEPGEVVGRSVSINRRRYTVIGVTPPDFDGHFFGLHADVFLPMAEYPVLSPGAEGIFDRRESSWVQAIGRLAPGATPEQANAQVGALFQALQERYPRTNANRTASVVSLGPIPGGGRPAFLRFVGALTAMVVLVLLVTCSNVAGMFLARASARRHEIAVRTALGSGPGRLVRHLLAESLVVFAIGGAVGIALADWAMAMVDLGALPLPVELSLDLRPDPGVLGAGLALTLLCGVVFGLAPALHGLHADLVVGLKADGSGMGGNASFLRRAFATAQVAFCLVLLVSAGLFLRSLQRAAAVDTGFDGSGVYVTSLDLQVEGYDPEGGRDFVDRLGEGLESNPSVASSAVATDLPLDFSTRGTSIALPGADETVGVHFNQVTPGYLETLGLRMLQGRDFTATDRAGSEEVAIVSRALAELVWAEGDALGQRFDLLLLGRPTVTVVGVVDDVKNSTLMEDPAPFVYRPLHQQYGSAIQVAVRSELSGDRIADLLHGAILEVDPGVSLAPVLEVDRVTSVGLLPQRIGATVASALGVVALMLAGMGLYGVVAFLVSRNTREIGIRMALGAGRARVLRRVLASGFKLALPGLVVGGLLATVLARMLASQNILLGLRPGDPAAIAGVAAALLFVVLLASAVPARRASRVDPSLALRQE